MSIGAMLLRRAIPGDEQAAAVVHVRSWQAAYRAALELAAMCPHLPLYPDGAAA